MITSDHQREATGMSGDLAQVVSEVTPYVVAAATTYGGAVLAKSQEEAANATVGVGRRLVQRIFGTQEEGEEVPEALADVIADPEDADNLGALRKEIRKALAADEELAEQIRRIVRDAHETGVQVIASGERSVAAHTNTGIIATGDRNTFRR
ncbi:MAG: hypothetical protein JWN52_6308 [Actinomycetia bacterium]|nr:hypothetical protein [Actinomycetes bacterium]